MMARIAVVGMLAIAVASTAEAAAPLKRSASIPLPDVEGRIDHLALDVQGGRLFVAAVGNDTVEIVDLATGTRTGRIEHQHDPHAVVFIPELNRLAVTNGESGTCDLYDAASLVLVHSIGSMRDADALRYDPATQRLYVGYGNGAIAVISAADGSRLQEMQVGGHPEGFVLDPDSAKLFVDVPGARQILVLDREQRAVASEWWLKTAQENFPMALDAPHRRLWIGFREPPRLLAFDADTGSVSEAFDTVPVADDVFVDAARRRVYVSGDGGLQILQQTSEGGYAIISRIVTAPGARTSLYVPELNRLFLAVPHRGEQPAEIRVYDAQ